MSKGDTRKATWVRTVRALRRLAERLRGHGFTVTEPTDLDVHPDFRQKQETLAWAPHRRRLRACVERWPGAEIDGDYDPRCCRFPKSCSASVYDLDFTTDEDLEPGSS